MQSDREFSDEIRRFEEQYAENPDSLVFARLADLHRKAGRPERALEILGDGLERHPDYLSAHIVRARCLRALDRTRASEDVFRHVLDLDGENLVALRSLAEMAWERGDDDTARDRLEELLELDPRNEEARELLEEMRGDPSADAAGAGTAPSDEGLGAEDDPVAAPDDSFAAGDEDDAFVAEDDPFAVEEHGDAEAFREPDDPFAADEEDGAFAASDDPFAAEEEDGPTDGDDAFVPEPEERDEDLIIEPTSRRETGDEAAGAAPDEEEKDEAPDAAGSSFRTGSFRVEPVADEAESGSAAGAADEADQERDDGLWDFLRPGGGADEPEEAAAEPTPEPGPTAPADEVASPHAGAGPTDDEATGGPAVGPAEEAEALRAQIEELRMRAEQETDLSDADGDLATETLANLYEAQGFYREAVEMYEELAAQRPDDEDLRRRLARAREALEETGEAAARETAEASVRSSPTDDVSGPATVDDRPAAREAGVTAAGQLRAVLRGEASPDGRDFSAP